MFFGGFIQCKHRIPVHCYIDSFWRLLHPNIDLGSSQVWEKRLMQNIKLETQIKTVIKSSLFFFPLRHLTKINPTISRKFFHAFFMFMLYNSNLLYFGISNASIRRMQVVLNAATLLNWNKKVWTHYPILLLSTGSLYISRSVLKFFYFLFMAWCHFGGEVIKKPWTQGFGLYTLCKWFCPPGYQASITADMTQSL